MESKRKRKIKPELASRMYPFTIPELVSNNLDLHSKYTLYSGLFDVLTELKDEGEMGSIKMNGHEYFISKSCLIALKREENLKKFFGD